MFSISRPHRPTRALVPSLLVLGLLLASAAVGAAPSNPTRASIPSWHVASVPPLTIVSFSLQPSTVSVGSTLSVSVSLSGGTAPYLLWFNGTVPGCAPPSSPVSSSSTQFQFSCQPSSPGGYSVHLDVVDSSVPAMTTPSSANLNVVSNSNGNNNNNSNNNGNGNGSGGGGSFSLPSGLLQVALIFGLVFLGTMVAIAAGTIATAALVSRRLRQINETLARMGLPPKDPKSPS